MAKRGLKGSVVIEGTVSSSTDSGDWDTAGIMIVTPEEEEYQEFFIEPDEKGRDLADHLYEFVRIYGALRRDSAGRQVVHVQEFEVLSFNSDGDAMWFDELDGDDERWEDERLIRALIREAS